MKKLFMAGILATGLLLTGCFDDLFEDLDPTTECITSNNGCGTYTTCADADGSGYYEYNGTKYRWYSSAGIYDAAEDLVDDMCGYKSVEEYEYTINMMIQQSLEAEQAAKAY